MNRIVAVLVIATLLIIPIYTRISAILSSRIIQEKLGYLPSRGIVKISSLDHKSLLSEWLFFKVLLYFGERIDPFKRQLPTQVDYADMYRFLDVSTYVDPYNIDAYYFAEAAFTWEIGRIREVDALLERGLKFRTWDFYLPFFLGFNHFYFLKDYKKASQYMEQAARMTGEPLLTNLAARFFYESNETRIGISFIKFMIAKTWNEKVKRTLEIRLKALERVDFLEKGVERFVQIYHRKPLSIQEMVGTGVIRELPKDPYGGKFYLDEKGKIRTTSKFAYGRIHGNSNKDREPR